MSDIETIRDPQAIRAAMEDTVEPEVSLLRSEAEARGRAIADAYVQAYLTVPEMRRNGIQTSFRIDERGPASVALSVKVEDFTGTVVATKTVSGDRSIGGALRFDF